MSELATGDISDLLIEHFMQNMWLVTNLRLSFRVQIYMGYFIPPNKMSDNLELLTNGCF